MNNRYVVGLFALLFFCSPVWSQDGLLLGRVIDFETEESIIEASIYNTSNKEYVFSNEDGYFSCNANIGDLITVSAIGYEKDTLILQSGKIVIRLKASISDVVTIYGKRKYDTSSSINRINLTQASIKKQALLAGESDPMRALHYTAGVTNTREGQSGLVVRGGLPDQNLILVDGVRVYNYNHLFGFLSFVNADVINDMTFYKAGVPPEYGGRSSSVVDINLLDGNTSKTNGNLSIGLLTSKIYYNTPIVKNKLALSGAVRLSYFDVVSIFQSETPNDERTQIGVSDVMVKTLYRPSEDSRMTVLYLSTRDRYSRAIGQSERLQMATRKWRNDIVSINYGRAIFSKSCLNIDGGYYGYNFNFEEQDLVENNIDFTNGSSIIKEYSLGLSVKSEVDMWSLKYGINAHKTEISPFDFTLDASSESIKGSVDDQKSTDVSIYLQASKKIGNFDFDNGLRLSTIILNSNSRIFLFPRFQLSHQFNRLKAGIGYDRNYQTNYQSFPIALGAPIEIWMNNDKVSISDQTTLSFDFQPDDRLSFSTSVYYKRINNLNEIGKVYQDFDEKLLEIESTVIGDGKINSYGLELDLVHEFQSIRQNVAIGIQKSRTEYAQLNNGEVFPTNFSRDFTFSYNMQIVFGRGWNFGLTGICQSGQPITLPVNSYFTQFDQQQFIFSDRNNARYPTYYRIDVLCQKELSEQSKLTLSIYNVTNKRNPFHIIIESNSIDGAFKNSEYQDEVLFGILPTIAYEFKF